MLMIEVEKEVPMPHMPGDPSERSDDAPRWDCWSGNGRPPKYPFAIMEVGDSFMIPSLDAKKIRSARTAATLYGRNHKKKFISRKQENGLRVWRIA